MGAYRRPQTPATRAKTDASRAEKLAGLHDTLTAQVRELATGPGWRRWLDTAARFHRYSFNNTLLILAQRPDATAVAGFEAWKFHGRHVEKGERGIAILAPVTRRAGEASEPAGDPPAGVAAAGERAGQETTSGGAGRVMVGVHVAHVWDVTQTSGEPLPGPPHSELLTGSAPAGLWDDLVTVATARGFTVDRGATSDPRTASTAASAAAGAAGAGRVNGFTDFTRRHVRVRDDVDDAQAVKTLAHELGHVLLHNPDQPGDPAGSPATAALLSTSRCAGAAEVEAESVAYLVAATHGLNTAAYTFPYVAGWAASLDRTQPETVVRDTGQRVLAAAQQILTVTNPAAPADPAVSARIARGAERTSELREHAASTRAAVLAPASAAADAERTVLSAIHTRAAAYYARRLHDAHGGEPGARNAGAALTARGIDPVTADQWGLGYAPASWTAVTDHLRAASYTDAQLVASGLAMTLARGAVVDRFRDRLMFPVHDSAPAPGTGDPGQVIAFLGRSLDPAAGQPGGPPKYLNSPETALYRKNEQLYGLGAPHTRLALAAGATPVIVEGPVDAIAVTAAGAGRYVGVAPAGTALTAGQVHALDRVAPLVGTRVVEAFDADHAGRDAALRAYPLLRQMRAWPTSAPIPPGHDPASHVAASGRDALTTALDHADQHPLAAAVLDHAVLPWREQMHWPEGQIGASRAAAAILVTLPSQQIAQHVAHLVTAHGMDVEALTDAVTDAVSRVQDATTAGIDAWGRPHARLDRVADRAPKSTGPATPDFPRPPAPPGPGTHRLSGRSHVAGDRAARSASSARMPVEAAQILPAASPPRASSAANTASPPTQRA